MFALHRLFKFVKTNEEIEAQLKTIKSWRGADMYWKIEALGDQILEKCKTGNTQYLPQIIERNHEHFQFLKPQIEESFTHLVKNL